MNPEWKSAIDSCPDCVVGYYWCPEHDIKYHRPGSPRVRLVDIVEGMAEPFSEPPDSCSCHLYAPCSYCEADDGEAPDA